MTSGVRQPPLRQPEQLPPCTNEWHSRRKEKDDRERERTQQHNSRSRRRCLFLLFCLQEQRITSTNGLEDNDELYRKPLIVTVKSE